MNGLRIGEMRMKPQNLRSVAVTGLYAGRRNHSDSQRIIKSFEDIPGPKPIPVLGNLWRYSSLVGEYSFEKIHSTYFKMYQQYGPIVKERLFLDRVLVHVFDPEDMIRVYMNEGKQPFRRSHRALEKYRKDRPSLYKSAGLFPSNGEEWCRFRHLFQPLLLSPHKANAYKNKLENVTEDMLKCITRQLDKSAEVDMQPILFNWAIECIGMITLDRRLGCLSENGNKEAETLVKAANTIHQAIFVTEINPMWKYIRTPSYARLVSSLDILASVVMKYLHRAFQDLDEKGDKTLLNSMRELENVDDKDVLTMILDMFLAGIDTTAYTTAFGLYNLAINQEAQEKLYQQLATHLPHKDSRISEKKNEELPYLQNVMRETLRINPVSVGTGRVIPTDLVLAGYHVPKDTLVILQHQVASKLSKHFTEPEKFIPDRWDKSHPYNAEIHPSVSSPFGFGPRLCIGRRYAEREMIMALGKVIRNYRISYHHDPIDSRNRLINVPDKPVKLRFEPREK